MATTDQNRSTTVLSGASRARRYQPSPIAADAPVQPGTQEQQEAISPVAVAPAPVAPPTPRRSSDDTPRRSTTTGSVDVAPARWGWRGSVGRWTGGLMKLQPTPEEVTYRGDLKTIREARFPRAVNVLVSNRKGGVGKTPTSLVMGGMLGHVRGGYVTVWEASEAAGTLSRRSDGPAGSEFAQLLRDVPTIDTAGKLSDFFAPQSSHADVLAADGPRAELTAPNVLQLRKLLDQFARITLTDTGNNPYHEAYQAAMHTADILVIPCTVNEDSLDGAEDILHVIDHAGGRVSADDGLASRVMVVLSHDGGPETKGLQEQIEARLKQLYVPFVEVPFDPAIRKGGGIVLGDLSEESTRAWTRATAMAVELLRMAYLNLDLVSEQSSSIHLHD